MGISDLPPFSKRLANGQATATAPLQHATTVPAASSRSSFGSLLLEDRRRLRAVQLEHQLQNISQSYQGMSRRSGAAAGGAGTAAGRPHLMNGGPASSSAAGGLGGGAGSGPPSHPVEQHPDHRAFLMRSLQRNDVDLAAIMELNSSLHSVRDAILHSCGELTLLDLGEGRIRLLVDGERGERLVPAPGSHDDILPDEEGQELCVDFLLRMKLRRKLLNRLARRLNRVAHAMDGNDVAPPGPPRYGDLRLHVDEKEVQAFCEMRERQERAIRAIQAQREKQSLTRSRAGDSSENPDAVLTPPKDAEESSGVATDPGTGEGEHPTASTSGAEGAIDYDVLKSYDDAYEKRVDPSSGACRYTLLDRPPEEEDFSRIRFGGGIGATHRSMSTKEKEAEFLRWQTALLGRIPDQPTFAETGMEYRVFLLEERRKRALEEAKSRKLAAAAADDSASDSDTSDAMDVEDNAPKGSGSTPKKAKKEAGGVQQEGEQESGSPQETKSDDDDEEELKSSEEKEESKSPSKAEATDDNPETVVIKKVKPISLAAVPSFYEQDLKRIKLIHNELITASSLEQSRRRVEEATKAYNHALRRSLELSNRRDHDEAQLQKILYQAHSMDPQAMGAISATENWMRAKQHFENDELNKVLPSRWGSVPTGTNATKEYGRKADGASQHVANCLADIVDSVAMISTGQLRPMQRYPIPYPRGGSHLDALKSVEAQFRKDVAVTNAKLRQSEEERHKAWRKMLRTQAECNMPYPQSGSSLLGVYSARHRGNVTLQNYHQIPLPNLRMSLAESVPHELSTQRPVQASYVPQRSHAPPPSSSSRVASESRYSTARVKERIGHDGTVAPVSEPKKSKDGLYLRPAGRTRKGMAWDAVHGVWVPSTQGTGE